MNVNILIKDIEVLLEKYKEFILSISPQTSPSNLARYMLYSKAFNSFSSSLILTQKGFYVESYNSIRFGLESGWLAILFEKRPELALQWLLLIPITEGNMEKAARNYRHDLGSPVWVRKQISKGKSDKEQKDNVYSALSTKSHANVSSTFYLTTDGEVNLYGPGAFESVEHMKKSLKAIKFCLGFLLADIDKVAGTALGVEWAYNELEIFDIAGIAYSDGKGGVKVDRYKINEGYQAVLLLYLTKNNMVHGSLESAGD